MFNVLILINLSIYLSIYKYFYHGEYKKKNLIKEFKKKLKEKEKNYLPAFLKAKKPMTSPITMLIPTNVALRSIQVELKLYRVVIPPVSVLLARIAVSFAPEFPFTALLILNPFSATMDAPIKINDNVITSTVFGISSSPIAPFLLRSFMVFTSLRF